MGRPSSYTPEIAEVVLSRLAEGESLRAICADAHMPGRETVRRWLEVDETFRGQYAHARENQAHSIAEVAMDDAVASADPRLAFDARRWFAAKVAPKVYGEKLQHTGDGGGAIEVRVTIADAGPEPAGETAP